MAKMRVDKLLANMGYGSRKEIKLDAKNGKISVNGTIIKDVSLQVDLDKDIVMHLDDVVKYREKIYVMMNKPQNVVSATHDNYDETVIDLLSVEEQIFDPFPVGRLDKDTEGLLILTNDGKLAHNLLTPKRHVDKLYYAHIEGGKLTDKDVKAFANGILFKDETYKCLPAKLEILETGSESKCKITIREGKFHQIKRMFEAIDKNVTYLKRMTMGPIVLDESLEPGQYRELTEAEMELLAPYMK